MGENIKLHLMEFAQVTENREGRHKTGTLVRASTEPIFWGAKWKVISGNKKQDAILFLEVISLTNTKCHSGSQLHGII